MDIYKTAKFNHSSNNLSCDIVLRGGVQNEKIKKEIKK